VTTPRGLSASEAALWRRVAATVVPLVPSRTGEAAARSADGRESPLAPTPAPSLKGANALDRAAHGPPTRTAEELDRRTLDASWDKRLGRGSVHPDAEVDLHGLGLHHAHDRLMASLAQARTSGARVLLVIAGKSRPNDAHETRGQRRGAIRAKLLDWLAASPHASAIAAIRPAHQRHGGAGAVYVILRRER